MEKRIQSHKYKRTVEDVRTVVSHAKLEEDDLLPLVQALYYADDSKDYKLLELDSELLSKINSGTELKFCGSKDDKVVLCSDNKTYEVKEAETSNSLVLVPNFKYPEEIEASNIQKLTVNENDILGVFRTYLEVKHCKPKFKKLYSLLDTNEYSGPEYESQFEDTSIKFYTTNELLCIIQSSEVELLEFLRSIEAFQLNGFWRLLELNYKERVLNFVLGLIDQQSWAIDHIPTLSVLEMLNELVPIEILNHILNVYTISIPEKSTEIEIIRRLNVDEVCRFYGIVLLNSVSGRMELEGFLKAWTECVPLDLPVNLDKLSGLIYISSETNKKIINYCPEKKLSEDLTERIQCLFKWKDKWTLDEIKPFIQPFTTAKIDANGILTKYARVSKVNGIRVYSSRHGK